MKLVPLLLLGWISSGAAQTFHISPANPILVGEPLSMQIDGLAADQNVTLTAERVMPALYRSQAVFSAPQGTLDLATAQPLANPAAAVKARIEVEKFRGPLLVIGGHDDQVWASGMMAQNIAERRAVAGLETVALIFPEAGHAIAGNGWLPTTQYNVGPSKVGGTPQANAAAQARAFPETIAFLQRTLYR